MCCTKVESGGYDIKFQTNSPKISKFILRIRKGGIAIFQCNIEKVLKYCAIKICNNEKVLQMQYFTQKSIAILQIMQ